MNEQEKYFIVNGGVGDFLQCLPFMFENRDKKFIVNTHFKKADSFFQSFDFYNVEYLNFNDIYTLQENYNRLKKLNNVTECPRSLFCNFDFGMHHDIQVLKKIDEFEDSKKPIIAIHPFGSDFANSVYKIISNDTKNINSETIKLLLNKSFNYFILGSEKELSSFGIEETSNIKHISFNNIITSLSAIKFCDQLIGSDSCFKTMSSMQRIKTTCFVSKVDDDFRDRIFLDPYVKENVMTIVKMANQIKIEEIKKTIYEKYNINF